MLDTYKHLCQYTPTVELRSDKPEPKERDDMSHELDLITKYIAQGYNYEQACSMAADEIRGEM